MATRGSAFAGAFFFTAEPTYLLIYTSFRQVRKSVFSISCITAHSRSVDMYDITVYPLYSLQIIVIRKSQKLTTLKGAFSPLPAAQVLKTLMLVCFCKKVDSLNPNSSIWASDGSIPPSRPVGCLFLFPATLFSAVGIVSLRALSACLSCSSESAFYWGRGLSVMQLYFTQSSTLLLTTLPLLSAMITLHFTQTRLVDSINYGEG